MINPYTKLRKRMFHADLEEVDADLADLMRETKILREVACATTPQDKEYWTAVWDSQDKSPIVEEPWERGDDLPF